MPAPHRNSPEPVAVDLFCGVGGLTHGLIGAGIRVVAGYDLDGSCRYAYEANNPGAVFHHRDILTVTAEEIAAHYPEGAVRVLVGCAPCQPYSSAAAKSKKGKSEKELSDEWAPLRKFLELVLEVRPEFVSMENVVRLATPGKFPVYAEFKRALEAAGYTLYENKVYSPDYGIPQARRRLILMASLGGGAPLPDKSHTPENYLTVQDVLRHLPPLPNGGADADDPLHRVIKLREINMRRVEASRPGGSWTDWPEELRLACHRKATGSSYGSVYGRMDPDKPGPTMTTQFHNIGTGRFIHPWEDRGLSLREGAILQTFPPEYRFVEKPEGVSMTKQARQIGNAVPPMLGRVVGQAILNSLERRTA